MEVEKRGGREGNNKKGWEIKRKGRGRRGGGRLVYLVSS
jgi:hypothetical protein